MAGDTEYAGSGRYELRRKIGQGGMGTVYEALDRERDAPVALKVLTKPDARWITQFKNEFRALADVVHPNLVAMYELVAEGEHLFFTMELVRGVHFLRYVRPRPESPPPSTERPPAGSATNPSSQTFTTVPGTPRSDEGATGGVREDPGFLALGRLRSCLRQLAEAVMAIHEAGMLHRDLKPSNVLVTGDGRLVVLDFGLITTVAAERVRAADQLLGGTAAYMAPEQGARAALTEASDWYAVGVMLYQALTGRLPFAGGSEDMLLDKQLRDPPPPRDLILGVPDDLNTLCMELLHRDPAKRPSGPDVLSRLGDRTVLSSAHVALARPHVTTRLVGRESHRVALHRAFATARDEGPVFVFVRGDSGMGKSALVRGFLDELGHRALVLRGRCYERESVPFKAVDSVIDAVAARLRRLSKPEAARLVPRHAHALARVFPALRQLDGYGEPTTRRRETIDPHVLRGLAFAALRELLTRISQRIPLIIALDDLQWGDIDSAGLLAALFAPPNPPSILLLGCNRPEDAHPNPFIDAFVAHTRDYGIDTRAIDVGPLSSTEARLLALVHLGDCRNAAARAERIAAESAGSPFFVEELARHALSTADSDDTVSLDNALWTRITRLPRSAMDLLATIAVAGRPIPQPLAQAAAQVSDPETLSLLKASCFVRTSSTSGDRFVASYHDRVRETVVAMLGEQDARERHLQLARAIEATTNPDAEMLARHYHGAGHTARASKFAELAARRSADSLAFEQAARLYRLALELTEAADARARMQTQLGDALRRAGHSADAAAAYLLAAQLADDEAETIELRRCAAEELLRGGHIADGLRLMDELLDSVDVRVPSTPNRAVASLLAGRLRLALRGTRFRSQPEAALSEHTLRQIDTTFAVAAGLGIVDAVRAAALGTRHLLMALSAGEPFRALQGLAFEACFLSVPGTGRRARTDRVLRRVDTLAESVGSPQARAFAHGARGISYFQFGDWAQCHQHCSDAHRLFRDECTGFNWEQSTATLFQAHSLAFMGRIRELNRFVDQALVRAGERGDRYLDTGLRVAVRFYAHAEHDDPDAAIEEIDRTLATWHSGRFDQQVWAALLAYLTIDGYAGAPERGIERHRRHWGALKRSRMLASQVLRAHHTAFLARLYLQAGTRDDNKGHLRRVSRAAGQLESMDATYTRGFASLLRGGLATHRGDDAGAIGHLVDAEARFAESNMALNIAACRIRRGQLLGGDEGAELIARGSSFITATGMSNSGAIARAVAPGFRASG